jgi:hypothetical protein
LVNKYNYSEIKNIKNVNNFFDPPHPKIYYTCYLFDEIIENEQKSQRGLPEKVIYHTQKALVFSSFYQFYQDFFFILKGIRNWSQKLMGLDLEQMIYNLLFNIPAPCPGIKKVCFNYSILFKLEFKLNPVNQIPINGADIKTIL